MIKQFNAGLLDAEGTLDATQALAREVLAEGEAHKGTGLNERAFGVNAILEKFKAQPTGVSEPDPPAYGRGDGDGDDRVLDGSLRRRRRRKHNG